MLHKCFIIWPITIEIVLLVYNQNLPFLRPNSYLPSSHFPTSSRWRSTTSRLKRHELNWLKTIFPTTFVSTSWLESVLPGSQFPAKASKSSQLPQQGGKYYKTSPLVNIDLSIFNDLYSWAIAVSICSSVGLFFCNWQFDCYPVWFLNCLTVGLFGNWWLIKSWLLTVCLWKRLNFCSPVFQ